MYISMSGHGFLRPPARLSTEGSRWKARSIHLIGTRAEMMQRDANRAIKLSSQKNLRNAGEVRTGHWRMRSDRARWESRNGAGNGRTHKSQYGRLERMKNAQSSWGRNPISAEADNSLLRRRRFTPVKRRYYCRNRLFLVIISAIR